MLQPRPSSVRPILPSANAALVAVTQTTNSGEDLDYQSLDRQVHGVVPPGSVANKMDYIIEKAGLILSESAQSLHKYWAVNA
jgi:hypothetical protein